MDFQFQNFLFCILRALYGTIIPSKITNKINNQLKCLCSLNINKRYVQIS